MIHWPYEYMERVTPNKNSRRRFLKLAGYGTLGLITGGFRPLLNNSSANQISKPNPDTEFLPDLDISLVAQSDEIAIFPGKPTQVWRYHATVHKGDKHRIIEIPRSYLGPIIKANQGEKIRVRFKNHIPDESIVHWHGLHVPAIMDGHPRDVVPHGQAYLYEFEVKNRAGTYWYHPHPHGRTGHQVYGGLAGLFMVSDDEEKAIGLPSGEYDIPLVIQDRTFDADNQLVYLSGHRTEQMNGFLGDTILVNGQPDFILPVATRSYRLRLLNGSNSRIYKLAWQDGSPLTVIGTDGGLLEKPAYRRHVMLGPAERVELWADFSRYPVGNETALVSLPFDLGMMGGMMGGGPMGRGMMGGGQFLPNGAGFPIFRVKVSHKDKTTLSLPERLSTIKRYRLSDAANLQAPRTFGLFMRHMNWTINGRTFQMEEVASDEQVRMNTLEIWEFINEGSGMGMMGMMNMPHPIHLHGKQFQVLERRSMMYDGYIDEGWKDTVLLMPGERIKILVRFEDYAGLFLYHCHNLEHEDMGMMRNYYINEQNRTYLRNKIKGQDVKRLKSGAYT